MLFHSCATGTGVFCGVRAHAARVATSDSVHCDSLEEGGAGGLVLVMSLRCHWCPCSGLTKVVLEETARGGGVQTYITHFR